MGFRSLQRDVSKMTHTSLDSLALTSPREVPTATALAEEIIPAHPLDPPGMVGDSLLSLVDHPVEPHSDSPASESPAQGEADIPGSPIRTAPPPASPEPSTSHRVTPEPSTSYSVAPEPSTSYKVMPEHAVVTADGRILSSGSFADSFESTASPEQRPSRHRGPSFARTNTFGSEIESTEVRRSSDGFNVSPEMKRSFSANPRDSAPEAKGRDIGERSPSPPRRFKDPKESSLAARRPSVLSRVVTGVQQSFRRVAKPSTGGVWWRKVRDTVLLNAEVKKELWQHQTLFGQMVAGDGVTNIADLTERIKASRYVVLQTAPWRVRWDVLQMFILIYIAIELPTRIGFGLPSCGGHYILDCLIELFFYVDMGLNFFTSFEDPDTMQIVTVHAKVVQNYLRGWFFVDLLSMLPIDFIIRISTGTFLQSFTSEGCRTSTNSNSRAFRLFRLLRFMRLLKLLRIVKIGRLMDRWRDELLYFLRFLNTLQLVLMLVYLGHICGCMFYLLSGPEWLTAWEKEQLEQGTLSLWTNDIFGDDPDSAPFVSRYVAASYWAFTTMTTVGYGDIQATTVVQRVFAMVGMVTGGMVLSGIIGKIVGLVEESNMRGHAYTTKMLLVEEYVKDLKLDRDNRSRILGFFRRQEIKPYSERQLLTELPFELRKVVLMHQYSALIDTVPFFQDGDLVFRTELCCMLAPLLLSARAVVYEAGEVGRHMYIVEQGELEVLAAGAKRYQQPARVLRRGAYIGEGALLGDEMRTESIIARTSLHLLSIDVKEMEDLLHRYPVVRVKMMAIYEKRLEQNEALQPPPEEEKPDTKVSILYDKRKVDRVKTATKEIRKMKMAENMGPTFRKAIQGVVATKAFAGLNSDNAVQDVPVLDTVVSSKDLAAIPSLTETISFNSSTLSKLQDQIQILQAQMAKMADKLDGKDG